jgi:TRAP-type mannitol/chloroaromatic compound transport system substrate-binding protein
MGISRKSFLKGVAAGIIALPAAIRLFTGTSHAQSVKPSGGLSNDRFEWKLVTTWPPNFPVIGDTSLRFARMVNEMSAGRLVIKVFGGGELVPALEAFDAVRTGVADIGHGAAYYWAGKSAAASFFASVPFGMNAQQVNGWLSAGGGMALWEKLYRRFNLIPLQGGNTGVQLGGWFNKEINSVRDLKGLKMRIPGLGGRVLEKAGGAPVLLAGGEIYTGLERGVIDATEWLGPYHDKLMGFHQIARYYYYPGWHEPGTMLEFFINKDRFERLPADLQAIVRTAALAVNQWCLSEMETRNAQTLVEFKQQGLEIRAFADDIIAQLRTHTQAVMLELSKTDDLAAEVYQSYTQYQQMARNYAQISESAYYADLLST